MDADLQQFDGRLHNTWRMTLSEVPTPELVETTLINELTVRNALRGLPGMHRDVLALIDVGGFTYAEAADILEIPVGTVMSRVSRARAKLLTIIVDQRPRPVPLRLAGSAK